MKKSFALLAISGLLLTCNQSLSAQDGVANKVFYAELAGPGGIMSVNFDTRFIPGRKSGIGGRGGVGFFINKIDGSVKSIYTFPVGLNYVMGENAASFEVGAGATFITRKGDYYNWWYDDKKEGNVVGYVAIMFRLAPPEGGFSFRGGFTPIINPAGNLMPMFAFSLGYAF
jgi:hypothetical protein